MYQPLLELSSGAAAAFVVGDRLLGESAGSLYGSGHRASFEAQGGAVYPVWTLANRNVLGRGVQRASSSHLSLPLWRRQQVCKAVRWLLYPFVSAVPLLRLLFPFAVPASAECAPRLLSAADFPECVTAVAFHPDRMVLAAAVDEGAGCSRVVVYDIAEGKETCVLTHAFQRNVRCVAWKPHSRDVLAVGCDGGALVWSLSFGVSPAATIYDGGCGSSRNGAAGAGEAEAEAVDRTAHCLFYRCTPHVPTTCLGFSCRDGRYLACGSMEHIALHFHDIRLPPSNSSLRTNVSVEGATEDVLFADDDTFAVKLVCGACAVVMIAFPSCVETVVPTAAPVLRMAKARALGPNHFFLHCARLEGVAVAHVNPFVGVQVIALVSTGVAGGIGGGVRRMACSGRRLYIALETGHLLVCHYGRRGGACAIIPVGVAELDAAHLAVFDGFPRGSLLAAVEASDQSVVFAPSYHA
ncbi:putative U4/U6 small nuclear ribonuclear protein [Trypanosoma rangeli]|uniref:Putative U4/U6 small nuclear ribonuclear protein n=1 Tax=Trypanosoma rangeli TaxID=5698 RepID=A0A3R7KGG9_TRYRA|nr:putative U4/U6 small nuclear ribonuclear protein [Trypanosoma rangeli]RNF07221.1 putative U4/U6 small nuclear ribonuclear protein [Trypanosoma rangeli]|eukprot:RNF07221.1 putative U4/U6 small nuclear ribonuclear protein [Trypanosoma rangeli]